MRHGQKAVFVSHLSHSEDREVLSHLSHFAKPTPTYLGRNGGYFNLVKRLWGLKN